MKFSLPSLPALLFSRLRRLSRLKRLGLYLVLGGLGLGLALPLSHLAVASAAESGPIPQTTVEPSRSSADLAAVETLLQAGQRHYQGGDYPAAVTSWSQAADLAEHIGANLARVRSLNNLSLAYQQLGQWSLARATLDESQTLLATLPPQASSTLAAQAQTWNTVGALEREMAQPQQATAAFAAAATSYQILGDDNGVLRSQINQARALQTAGYTRQASDLLTAQQPPLADRPPSPLTAAGLLTLGNLYRSQGQLNESRQYLNQSLEMAQQLQDPDAIAAAQLALGNTATAAGSPDQAQRAYEQVIATTGDPTLRIQARLSLAGLQLAQPERQDQGAMLATLAAELDQLPPGQIRTYARLNLADLVLAAAVTAYPLVQSQLVQADQEAVALGDTRAQSYARGTLGRWYQLQNQPDVATALTSDALILANQAHAPEVSYRWNAQLGTLQRQSGDQTAAIASYTVAVNTLRTLRRDLVTVNTDLQFSFRQTVEPIYRELVDLLTQDPQASTAALKQAQDVVESLQIAELEDFFREACLAVVQNIDQVVDSTAHPTAVVYPILLPRADRLEVIFKLPNQPLFHHSVAIPAALLEARVQQLRQDLPLPYTINRVKTEAAQIYDWLLRPVADQLTAAQIETLVFVLDGPLRNLPMGLLYDGEQYLIERYSIAIAPGLQLVDPKPLTNQNLAVIVAGLSQERFNFPALHFVEAEVNQVEAALSSQVLFNHTFTEMKLETTIRDIPFPVVHLATHGQFSSDPDETFVLAWDKKIPLATLNKILRNSEQSRESAIELLVLSACETAAGDNRATLGLAGVAVKAGARSTLASLWKVDDEASADLMARFYHELNMPESTRSEALQRAQIAILKQPKYSHPRYWAPYILVGNWL